MKKLLFLSVFFLFNVNFVYAESYMCIAEASGGVFYDTQSKNWIGAIFNADEKLMIKKTPEDSEDAKYRVYDYGKVFPRYVCEKDFKDNGYLFCSSAVGFFKFNKNNLRFLSSYEAGYVDGNDNNENTPFISVGKCSPM